MIDASNGSIDDFIIYSIKALFGALRNAAVQKVNDRSITLIVAENEFSKDFLCNTHGFECDFHKIINISQYCSKSIVKRWCFTICDYCCEYLNIKLIEGVHRPKESPFLQSSDQERKSGKEASGTDKRTEHMSISDRLKDFETNGVSGDHRSIVSERSYDIEQRRHNECKPLYIINYGKASTSVLIIQHYILTRTPRMMFQALLGSQESSTSDALNLNDFPPIRGRGINYKRKTTDI